MPIELISPYEDLEMHPYGTYMGWMLPSLVIYYAPSPGPGHDSFARAIVANGYGIDEAPEKGTDPYAFLLNIGAVRWFNIGSTLLIHGILDSLNSFETRKMVANLADLLGITKVHVDVQEDHTVKSRSARLDAYIRHGVPTYHSPYSQFRTTRGTVDYEELKRRLEYPEERVAPSELYHRELTPCNPPDDPNWPAPKNIGDIRILLERLPHKSEILCLLVAAKLVLPIFERQFTVENMDTRPRNAIEITERWIKEAATEFEVEAAADEVREAGEEIDDEDAAAAASSAWNAAYAIYSFPELSESFDTVYGVLDAAIATHGAWGMSMEDFLELWWKECRCALAIDEPGSTELTTSGLNIKPATVGLQTFLPFADFRKSLEALDQKRLGNQRREARQIFNILTNAPTKEGMPSGETAWRNHPAVRMWKGYEDALAKYYNTALQVWEERGGRNVILKPISTSEFPPMPPWLGDERIHRGYRSQLLKKNPDFYCQYDWQERAGECEYLWPVPKPPTIGALPNKKDKGFGTFIVVDVQPEYLPAIEFHIGEMWEFISQCFEEGLCKRLIVLYNGYETLGMIEEGNLRNWYIERIEQYGGDPEIINEAEFYDKGYAFFRACMDHGYADSVMIPLIRYMLINDINDSRDIEELPKTMFEDEQSYEAALEFLKGEDVIYLPDLVDFLETVEEPITLVGGGERQCLKEVGLALQALGKDYEVIGRYMF